MKVKALLKKSEESPFVISEIERKDPLESEILIKILYCGICHSDLHVAKNEWKSTIYPLVPGHEILGVIDKVGSNVKKHKVGDFVGVGCIIGSCGACSCCQENQEQYCQKGFTLVFNSLDPLSGEKNFGGFSSHIVTKEDYAVAIPKEFKKEDLPRVAPLLCAGITTFSPLTNWNIEKGKKVGIVGVGGLGHLAIKIAKGLGADVVAITRSSQKTQQALRYGADEILDLSNITNIAKLSSSLDFILSTASSNQDLDLLLNLLKKDGTLCLVGLPEKPYSKLEARSLINQRRSLAGSLIGSIEETQKMLNFCCQHSILADIELIDPKDVNEALSRLEKGLMSKRFVIDMSKL